MLSLDISGESVLNPGPSAGDGICVGVPTMELSGLEVSLRPGVEGPSLTCDSDSEGSEVFSNLFESSSNTDFLDKSCWAMAEGCEGLTSRFSLELGSCLDPGTELCCLVSTDQASYFFSNSFNWSLSSRVEGSHALVSLPSAGCPDLVVRAASCSRGPCRGGVRGLDSLGLGLAGEEAAPAPGTATVSRPGPRRGSLGLHSEPEERVPTLTDKEGEGAASAGDTNEDLIEEEAVAAGTLRGDFSGGASPGDFRLGDFSLGSRPRESAEEVPGPNFVGETIFSLESSGLAALGLSELTWLLAGPLSPGPGAGGRVGPA